MTYLESLTYTCAEGYKKMYGDETRRCQKDGTLGGSDLVCTRKFIVCMYVCMYVGICVSFI